MPSTSIFPSSLYIKSYSDVLIKRKIYSMSSYFSFFPTHSSYWWYLKSSVSFPSYIWYSQLLFCCQPCQIQRISSFPKANRPDIPPHYAASHLCPDFFAIDFVCLCVSWDCSSFFQNILAPQHEELTAKWNVTCRAEIMTRDYFMLLATIWRNTNEKGAPFLKCLHSL